jgi:hypothetical protein
MHDVFGYQGAAAVSIQPYAGIGKAISDVVDVIAPDHVALGVARDVDDRAIITEVTHAVAFIVFDDITTIVQERRRIVPSGRAANLLPANLLGTRYAVSVSPDSTSCSVRRLV